MGDLILHQILCMMSLYFGCPLLVWNFWTGGGSRLLDSNYKGPQPKSPVYLLKKMPRDLLIKEIERLESDRYSV